MENVEDDSATLEAFRLDVATFRKTRHENVILYMGACMNPPKLAIVTSLCKGKKAFLKHYFGFKKSTFRKTRNKNVILYLGACMYPQKLVIVKSLCKGKIAFF